MKKMIAVLMALVLALTLGSSALAEDAAAVEITPNNWLLESLTTTEWIEKDGRTTLTVEPVLDDLTEEPLAVKVYAPDSAFEGTEWTFFCKYDPDTHNLNAVSVVCFKMSFGEDGEVELAENQYDKDSDAVFELGEDGLLTLRTTDDESISLLGFEPLPAAEFKGTELTEEQQALFEKTLMGLMGVNYEPVCVLGEADYMLCILCQATVVYPDAEPHAVIMTINNSGETPVPVITQITEDDSEG